MRIAPATQQVEVKDWADLSAAGRKLKMGCKGGQEHSMNNSDVMSCRFLCKDHACNCSLYVVAFCSLQLHCVHCCSAACICSVEPTLLLCSCGLLFQISLSVSPLSCEDVVCKPPQGSLPGRWNCTVGRVGEATLMKSPHGLKQMCDIAILTGVESDLGHF